jgi:hypothetical protein
MKGSVIRWRLVFLILAASGLCRPVARAQAPGGILGFPLAPAETPGVLPPAGPFGGASVYEAVIRRTAGMVNDTQVRDIGQRHGLSVLNVTWEDTGRFKGSSVGPNISDMTIQVRDADPATGSAHLYCMPVIRHPNFSDRSADIPPERFYLRVGNQSGQPLRRVDLRTFLGDLRRFLSQSDSWGGDEKSLLASRDTHVLVSAQACFLPIPRQGTAQFNPVLFNYQAQAGDPAVLTILATREGTSVTVITNERDGFSSSGARGQRLFFNQAGQRASLTGQRQSDFVGGNGPRGNPDNPGAAPTEEEQGLNVVLLVQVPLKQKNPPSFGAPGGGFLAPTAAAAPARNGGSDVEAAVVGHGDAEGPFTEIDGLPIQRDSRFPVRVTVQFYKATSNGVVSARDMAEISQQIDRVYRDADYVGSLVTDGPTGRPTENTGPRVEPPDWWLRFKERRAANN